MKAGTEVRLAAAVGSPTRRPPRGWKRAFLRRRGAVVGRAGAAGGCGRVAGGVDGLPADRRRGCPGCAFPRDGRPPALRSRRRPGCDRPEVSNGRRGPWVHRDGARDGRSRSFLGRPGPVRTRPGSRRGCDRPRGRGRRACDGRGRLCSSRRTGSKGVGRPSALPPGGLWQASSYVRARVHAGPGGLAAEGDEPLRAELPGVVVGEFSRDAEDAGKGRDRQARLLADGLHDARLDLVQMVLGAGVLARVVEQRMALPDGPEEPLALEDRQVVLQRPHVQAERLASPYRHRFCVLPTKSLVLARIQLRIREGPSHLIGPLIEPAG